MRTPGNDCRARAATHPRGAARVRSHSQPRGATGETMHAHRTGTVTPCLHLPGLVTVWACLTHPLRAWVPRQLRPKPPQCFSDPPTCCSGIRRPQQASLLPAARPGTPVRRTTQFCWGEGEGEGHDSCLRLPLPCGLPGCSEAAPQLRTTSGESAGKALPTAGRGLSLLPEALGAQRPVPVEHGSLMQVTPTSTPQVARLVATWSPESTTLCRAPSHTEPQGPHG